jgi:hypothetical protein
MTDTLIELLLFFRIEFCCSVDRSLSKSNVRSPRDGPIV